MGACKFLYQMRFLIDKIFQMQMRIERNYQNENFHVSILDILDNSAAPLVFSTM